MVTLKKDALVNGFLSGFSRIKQADETRSDSELLEGIGAGAALGGSFGAVLPLLLRRFRGRRMPSGLLDKQITTHLGALLGGAGGGFFGSGWLPQTVQQGQEGFRTGAQIFPQKKADETLRGIGTGALVGAGVSAGAALPVLFSRLGKRLPTKLLNKILLGRALSGAATGGVAGGLVSKPKDKAYHYYYHKSLKEKGVGE